MSTAFTDTERAILRIVQFQLPDTLTPYADIAREVGTDEETVLNLLRRMKEDGAIRRFGASIKHQKTGWTHNAMVAWIVDEADSDAIGEVAARTSAFPMCISARLRPRTGLYAVYDGSRAQRGGMPSGH